jgi:CRP-like cAMP-binding protein
MALDKDIAIMQSQPLLAVLPREALRLLAFSAETRVMRVGDILFRKGDRADGGYIVVTGLLALDSRADGSPAVELARPGYLLGETALFTEVTRPATAIARELSTVMKLPHKVMTRVLLEFPEAAATIRDLMAERVRGLTAELSNVRRDLSASDR